MIELVSAPPSPPECFICTETSPAPWRSDCKCVDRYIHEACLRRLVESSEERPEVVRCSVCAQPYGNVKLLSVTRLALQADTATVWFFILLDVAMVICTINMVREVETDRELRNESADAVLRTSAVVFGAASAAMLVAILYLVRRTGTHVLCRRCTRTERQYFIHAPFSLEV